MPIQDLTNEEYRALPQDSATVLKGCLDAPKKGLTPKPRTKSLDTGLKVHEFILERESFLEKYECGLNPDDYPNALHSVDELRNMINEYNSNKLPALPKIGAREVLIENLMKDSPDHLAHVTDLSTLSVKDLKDKIALVNQASNRGLLSKSGTAADMVERLTSAGVDVEYFPLLLSNHVQSVTDKEVLPYAEYMKYEGMYQSLLEHLRAGQDQPLFQWLLYVFENPNAMETEVSMIGDQDKCRMDMMFCATDRWFGFDLKSAKSASEEAFSRQAYGLHYDLQAAHYKAVSAECERPLETFSFIVIEPVEPYAVNIFTPDQEFMVIGEKKRNYAKKRLTEWREKGDNTCYTPIVKPLTPPAYAGGVWDEEDS